MKRREIVLAAVCVSMTGLCILLGVMLAASYRAIETLEQAAGRDADLLRQLEAAASVYRIGEPTPDGEEGRLDREYRAAMAEWSGNTLEGVAINLSFGDQWKEEMDAYYRLLNDALHEDRRQWLASSQEAWEVRANIDEELAWQVADQDHHGGTIMKLIESQIYLDRYRTRAKQLMELYGNFTSGI